MSAERWLSGDLAGVEPRSELELLRQTVQQAVAEGTDVATLVRALVQLDPVAGAELIAGPRAIPHAAVVRAALHVAAPLEGVLPPMGLYRRLADLAPEALPDILHVATARHGDAAWIWRLSATEAIPGTTPLRIVALSASDVAPHRALDHGYVKAVQHRAATGDVASLRALHDRATRSQLLAAIAAVLEAGVDAPVVAWIAAWHGPDVDPLFARVARQLRSESARRTLRAQSAGLSATRAVLDA